MGIAPRRLWGWEPEQSIRHVYERVELQPSTARFAWLRALIDWANRVANPPLLIETVTSIEPEFDRQQYELMSALHEHEASLNSLGIPIDEAMSPLADPDNPDGEFEFVPRARRDWSEDAVYQEQQAEKWGGDNFTPARKWFVEKRYR